MTRWLDGVIAGLIRMQGREFAASYGDELIATIHQRGSEARRRGSLSFVRFAVREIFSLATAAARQRLVPRLRAPSATADPSGPSWGQIGRELRLACRRLMRAPVFSAAALLTLTLATAAMLVTFALLWRIAIAPLPYPAADRLIALDHGAPGVGIDARMGMSIGLYREYAALPSVEALSLYTIREGTLTDDGTAARARFMQATPALGIIAGLNPRIGRWFTSAEGEAGGPNVIAITDAMWRQRFSADPEILGRTLRVDGTPYEVVGVLEPGSGFIDPRVQFFLPLSLPKVWTRAAGFNYAGVARIAPGVTIEQARREQNAVIADIQARYPGDREIGDAVKGGLRSRALPLKHAIVGETATTLWALLGATTVLFLMACANLANLFLLRHESRLVDQAVQRALGAGSWILGAHILFETVILAAIGGALASALASAAIAITVANAPADVPRLTELRFDATVAGFAVAVSAVAAAACAWLPLVRLWTRGPAPIATLERMPLSTASAMRARNVLMASQVMLSVLLLCAATLMTQSFRNLLRVHPGFDAASRLVFDVNLPRSEYRTRIEAAAFHAMFLDRLSGLPGLRAISAISTLPLEGAGLGDPLSVRGRVGSSADAAPMVRFRRVSNDYFAAMRIPLRAGRFFDTADGDGRTDAVVIDDALARLYFGDQDPLGQRIRPIEGDPEDRWLTIVGIVGNTVTESLAELSTVPKMYVPMRGSMWADVPSPHDMTYVALVDGGPLSYVDSARTTLAQLNPRIAFGRPESLEVVLSRARTTRALTVMFLVAAAIVAATVGSIGIYAIVSYAVSQRRGEIGVRIALGATPSQIIVMIVRQGSVIVVAGIGMGVAASLGSAHVFRTLLFGVGPTDWVTHALVAAGTLLVAVLACWWPASQAARRTPKALLGS
jgi:putative ABC transport system permease protein